MTKMSKAEAAECKALVADMVLKAIPFGRLNAISRQRLSGLCGMNDRAVRECIELLRDEGNFICNDGTGYYIAETIDDIERQYRKDHARALSVLKRLKPFRQALREAGRLDAAGGGCSRGGPCAAVGKPEEQREPERFSGNRKVEGRI